MDKRPGSTPSDAPAGASGDARSLGELFRDLSRDASALVRHEIALARAEVTRNVRTIAAGAAKIVIGGVLAGLGGLVLLGALVAFVGDLLGDRYALAALLVGLLLVISGGALAALGIRAARAASLAPGEAIAVLRDTGEWAGAELTGLRAALTGRGADGTATERIPFAEPSTKPRPPAAEPGPNPRASAQDEERGRRLQKPLPVTAPLWKRVLHEFMADDIANQAAKVAYYFFLSLPPSAMVVFGLTGFFGGQETGDWMTARMTASLPGEASDLVSGFVDEVVHRKAPGPLSIGLLLALWAGSNVFTALEDTLNQCYGVRAQRSWVRKKLVAIGMLAACALLFLGGSAVLVGGGGIARSLGLGAVGRTVWGIAQVPLGFALITATFWLVYYVLPLKDQRGCRKTLLKASAAVAVIFVLASLAFRLYVTNFGSYSATYGLLGTVTVLLLWMYVTSLVVLLGGEIASEMERTS